MNDSQQILNLYRIVLRKDVDRHRVERNDILVGIRDMKEMYMPRPNSLSSMTQYVVDYDNVSHRLAYLHKYAPLHTAMVSDMLSRAIIKNPSIFSFLSIGKSSTLKLCSLGAGPGTDTIGVMHALHSRFGYVSVSATLVDCKAHWKDTFTSLTEELRSGDYRSLGINFAPRYLDWKYLESNLLCKMNKEVNQAVGSANLITMVKFLSAAACVDSEGMIKKIFNAMKPGAMILYIDNAAGGFRQLVTKAAKECRFASVFGPLHHEHYINEAFSVKLFGYTSCYQTKVTVHMLQKEMRIQRDVSCTAPSNIFADRTNLARPNPNELFSEALPKFKCPTINTTNVNIVKPYVVNSETSKYSLSRSQASDHQIGTSKSVSSKVSQTTSTKKNIYQEALVKRVILNDADSGTTLRFSRQSPTSKIIIDTVAATNKFHKTASRNQNMFIKCTSANFPNHTTRNMIDDKKVETDNPTTGIKQTANILSANPSIYVTNYNTCLTSTRPVIIRKEADTRNSQSAVLSSVSPQVDTVLRSSFQDKQEENCCCCVLM